MHRTVLVIFALSLFMLIPVDALAQTTQGPTKIKGVATNGLSLEVTGPAQLDGALNGTSASFSGTVSAGATDPVTIGGASGSCTGLYAKADGTGCGNPGGGSLTTSITPTGITPPIAGQYVIIYPTNVNGVSTPGSTGLNIEFGPYCIFAPSSQSFTWSDPVLPSYVNPANVTAVYAFAISENGSGAGGLHCPFEPTPWNTTPGVSTVIFFGASGTGTGPALLQLNPASNITSAGPWTLQQTTQLLTGMTGANIPSITTVISMGRDNSGDGGAGRFGGGPSYTDIPLVGYIVYYTGPAPPQSTLVNVVAPLQYDPSNNAISISPQAEFPGNALVPSTVATLPVATFDTGWIVPISDGTTATDCTVGGGSTYVQCQSNGTIWVAYSSGGSGIIQITGAVAAGPGSGSQVATITPVVTAATCGDSTHVSQVTYNAAGQITACSPVAISGGGGGGGLTSLNSLTGPALTLGSSDSSVTITPSGTNIDLKAASVSGGVQYNPSNTTIAFMGDSSIGSDNNALSSAITVTAVSCASSICTFTNSGTNGLSTGDWINAHAITSPSFFTDPDGGYSTGETLFQVLSAGLTSTSFEIAYSLNTGTGTGGTVYTANGYLVFQIMQQKFFAGHGIPYVHQDVLPATDMATYFGPVSPSVTGNPGFLIMYGDEDVFFPSNPAACNLTTIEGYYSAAWTEAHTLGYKIIQATTRPGSQNSSYSGCAAGTLLTQETNQWIRQQLKSTANTASGAYIDSLVDFSDVTMGDNNYTSPVFQWGGMYYPAGVAIAAPYFNEAMANGGSKVVNPIMVPNGETSSGYDLIGRLDSPITLRVGDIQDVPNGLWDMSVDTEDHVVKMNNTALTNLPFTSNAFYEFYKFKDTATEDAAVRWYDPNYGSSPSPSNNNYIAFGFYGAGSPPGIGDVIKAFVDGRAAIPALGANPSPLCTTTGGVLTNTCAPTLTGTGLATAYNQAGTFSAANVATGIVMQDTSAGIASPIEGLLEAYPSTPFTLTALFSSPSPQLAFVGAGLAVSNTTTTNAMWFGMLAFSPGWYAVVYDYTTPALQSTNHAFTNAAVSPYTPFVWLRLKDDGTNIVYSFSYDGILFTQVYTAAKSATSLGSGGFNYIGPVIQPQTSAVGTVLESWTITTP
jgi:hypothetical protein